LKKGLPELYGWSELLKAEKEAASGKNRESFPFWLRHNFSEWKWEWKYQRYVYERLARLSAGNSTRLMIFMPPRHGKSEMVTVRYTAWRLLKDPKLNVILGSYNQKLANKFSRKIKRIVQDPKIADKKKLADAFPSLMNSTSEWETSGGGVVRSVGVGAGIAGFGAGLIVIDDPVRNRADAESETFRDKVWDWFNDDIYTRLEPNASIILIQTRWHEDDLAGRLLKEQEDGGEKWEVISLPAIAEEDDDIGRKPGQALCPARYNIEALERTKRKLGSYSFSSLYQQNPVPSVGGTFKREWFKNIIEEAPPNLRWKRGYDLAVSLKTTADYTASFRCAYDKAGNLYIADGFRKRIEYPDQRRYIIERMVSEKSTEHCVEAAMHGKALVQDLRTEPTVRSHALCEVEVNADKLTRALAWLNLAEAGKVYLVRGPWINDFVDEICRFPSGKHDDQVDAVSVAVSKLATKEVDKTGYGF
jgi:predicted phage terminase large subunit-like protein